jgi:hypothetical protein
MRWSLKRSARIRFSSADKAAILAIRQMTGKPKSGFEAEYERAWRHRVIFSAIYDKTPWWQYRKRQRRLEGWLRAIENVYRFGENVGVPRNQKYEQHDWGKQ